MRKYLLAGVMVVCLSTAWLSQVRAQGVFISDTYFRSWLMNNGFSQCMISGFNLDTTCPAVINAVSLHFVNSGISNLEGIKYFRNLDTLSCNNASLTTLPELPRGLVYLSCTYNQLNSVSGFPASLKTLGLWKNNFSSLPALPDSLEHLDCMENSLSTLPTLPVHLKKLWCSNNNLTVLPSLPTGLQFLTCQNNQLTVLPPLPDSLRDLSCGSNQLTALPMLPPYLKTLGCSNNDITILPLLPNGLTTLTTNNCLLDSLPELPDSLSYISCIGNRLYELPVLPSRLLQLECNGNRIDSLPTLPNNLQLLKCSSNRLTHLPHLPPKLTRLDCSYNQLTLLPELPDTLNNLTCSYNQLVSLPRMGNKLVRLYANDNKLKNITAFPDSMVWCDIKNNITLSCLPHLKRISTLNFSNTGISCVPEYGNVTNSTPLLAYMPICDTFNSPGCGKLWNIMGSVYFDKNNNCIKNNTDEALKNVKVKLSRAGQIVQQMFTGPSGYYYFDTDTDDVYSISIDTVEFPFRVACPSSNVKVATITSADSIEHAMDFGVKCKSGSYDLAAESLMSFNRLRPASQSKIRVKLGDVSNFYGQNCANGVSGKVKIKFNDTDAHYVPSSSFPLVPDSVDGNELTYLIANFGTAQFDNGLYFEITIDTTAAGTVCFTVTITTNILDLYPGNNVLNICLGIVNSFDPNDKAVYPEGDIDTTQKELTYKVRFQNTGTAEAINIFIEDTLDANLDYSSFKLVDFSHQPMVQLRENIVRFNFPNINLPDSNANEPESHGYVVYKVKLKDNLPIGTQINNTAYIYFDFNEPVVTNTTTNTITVTVNIPETQISRLSFTVFPNPANNELNIQLGDLQAEEVNIYNVDGKLMSNVKLPANNRIDISSLANGAYIAEIKVQGTMQRIRWVKM